MQSSMHRHAFSPALRELTHVPSEGTQLRLCDLRSLSIEEAEPERLSLVWVPTDRLWHVRFIGPKVL